MNVTRRGLLTLGGAAVVVTAAGVSATARADETGTGALVGTYDEGILPVSRAAGPGDRRHQLPGRNHRVERRQPGLQEEIDKGPGPVLRALTSEEPDFVELRQNSPFAGVLPQPQRQKVLEAFSRSGWAQVA
jgi:hypothetical protein